LPIPPPAIHPGKAARLVREVLIANDVIAYRARHSSPTLTDVENAAALAAGGLLLLLGATRRPLVRLGLVGAAVPLLVRGLSGHWPILRAGRTNGDSKQALGGERGIHVRESVRLELPIAEVYRFWRRLDNLPRFMHNLDAVTEHAGTNRSHWVVAGPAGLRVEWDAEIINEVENKILAWRSLPGADVVTAGAVNFSTVRDGRSTQVTVHLQYAPPAGRAGALLASLFGRAPEQTVREDLRRLKQLLEAGELAQGASTRPGSRS
jgi:uncharacterized membrane protein